MMTKNSPSLESKIVREICQYLSSLGGVVFKVHGGPYQASGFPDILYWYRGEAFAFEVKRSTTGYGVTPLQALTLEQLAEQGVHAAVVHSIDEVRLVIKSVDYREAFKTVPIFNFDDTVAKVLDEDVTDRVIGK